MTMAKAGAARRASARWRNRWAMVVLAWLGLPVAAGSEPLPAWKVDHMQIAIQILPKDRIRVEEQIAIDLGHERHRQLERRIRLAPLEPGGCRLDLRLIAVTDAQGAAWPIRTWQWGDDLEIRIGNGESFLTGRQGVKLVYEVDGAVRPGRKRDALVWDVGGGPWEVPIVDTRITVNVPPGAEPEMIDAGSDVGRPGELVRHADFKTVDRAQVRFSLMTGLAPRETCRIFVAWPTELTAPIAPVPRFLRALAHRPWWGIAIAALVVVGLSLVARQRARASAKRLSLPALAPAEVAWLRSFGLGSESMLATALDLARRKALTLRPAADGFQLELTPDPSAGAEGAGQRAFETEWRARILAAPVGKAGADRASAPAELAWRARLARPAVASALERGLVAAGYLHDRRPRRLAQRVAIRMAIASALGAFLALLVGARFPASWPGILTAAGVAACLPLVIEGRRRSARGERTAAWARGFAARAERGEVGAGPADDARLPLAVALGVGPEVLLAQAQRPSYWPAPAASAPPAPGQLWRELEALARCFPDEAPVSGRG